MFTAAFLSIGVLMRSIPSKQIGLRILILNQLPQLTTKQEGRRRRWWKGKTRGKLRRKITSSRKAVKVGRKITSSRKAVKVGRKITSSRWEGK